MARITVGGRQGTSSLLRNVRTRIRVSVLEERITWDTIKGSIQKRPGRERQQEKFVKDLPVQEYLLNEYQERVADALKVLNRGWLLSENYPVEVWMGDVLLDEDTWLVNLSAKVDSNNVATTCGFLVDITPAFTAALTIPANETPVQSHDFVKITASMDVGMLTGLNLYFLPFATDGNKTAYGIIKHIELPVMT